MKINLIIILFAFTGIQIINAQSLNIPLITVNETEIAYTQVDEIHFSIFVESYSKEIKEARNKNRKIAESIFDFLEEKEIPKQYIQTKRMLISRNYIRNRAQGEYDGFKAYQEIYVCLKNINAYDEIIDSLLIMDIKSINGPEFKSSSYEETLKTARLKALKKAKASAEEMANALGQKIGKAKLISTNISRNSKSSYSTQTSSNIGFQNNKSSFEVGEIEIVASVEVSFELIE